GETGPFLALEQVRIARAVAADRRTTALSVYNLLGYAAAALGAATVGVLAAYRPLFVVFLAGAAVQCAAYRHLPREAPAERRRPAGAPLPSAPLIRRLAALGALDSFAGGFVRSEEHTSELQSRGHLVCRLLLEKKKKKK